MDTTDNLYPMVSITFDPFRIGIRIQILFYKHVIPSGSLIFVKNICQ